LNLKQLFASQGNEKRRSDMFKSSGFIFFALFTGVNFPGQRVDCPPGSWPDIQGVVTSISRTGPEESSVLRVLVEEEPSTEWGAAKANIQVSPNTRIFKHPCEDELAPEDLEVGLRIQVWFGGPVALSYPVQAAAAYVFVE
jgi:hypothetical protein